MANSTRIVKAPTDKRAITEPKADVSKSATRLPVKPPTATLRHFTADPNGLSHTDIFRLQRTLGNRAVGALLGKPITQLPAIQAKLTVSAPGDKYEQEADRVAEQIMRMPPLRNEEPDENEKPAITRLSAIQRKDDGAFEADENFTQRLNTSKGQGQPLPSTLRNEFEAKFGADFKAVRIHTDTQADHLNQSIQARAFTTGQDVYFRRGEFAPENRDGQAVIAHELTHVLQQTGTGAQGSVKLKKRNPAQGIHAIQLLRFQHGNDLLEVDGTDATFQTKIKDMGAAKLITLLKAMAIAATKADEDINKLQSALAYIKVSGNSSLKGDNYTKIRGNEGSVKNAYDNASSTITSQTSKRSQESSQKQKEQQRAAIERQNMIPHANVYWNSLQNAAGGALDFAAPLDFLSHNKFVKIAKPHRCFLSSFEKENGYRHNNKYAISCEMIPGAEINTPGSPLVLHLHCDGNGKILAGSIKYKSQEKQGGSNVVVNQYLVFLSFLSSNFGINGENIEEKVGAFD